MVLPYRQYYSDNDFMKIGLVIKALRSERGLSQEALALEVETATSNLSRIEKGTRTPSLDLTYRLANSLGVAVSEIFRAAESGELPDLDVRGRKKGVRANKDGLPDYDDDAVKLRRLFRELTPSNRVAALEILKALKNVQINA